MNITGFQHADFKLPILSDKELNEYHTYQLSRIKCMKEFEFCYDMLPVATALKELSEQELKQRGLWLKK